MCAWQCQSAVGSSRQGLTNRGEAWQDAPWCPRLPTRYSRSKGSWKRGMPRDQQLLWLWLSDWPGCCTPASAHLGHLTLGKLTNAFALGVPAECYDPKALMTFLHWVCICSHITAQLCLPSFKSHNTDLLLHLSYSFVIVWVGIMWSKMPLRMLVLQLLCGSVWMPAWLLFHSL